MSQIQEGQLVVRVKGVWAMICCSSVNVAAPKLRVVAQRGGGERDDIWYGCIQNLKDYL